jgi:uncharacterized membrane protein
MKGSGELAGNVGLVESAAVRAGPRQIRISVTGESMMSWLQRYRVRHFLRTSFWVMPVAVLVATVGVGPLVRWLDYKLGWRWLDFTPDGARAILSGLSTSMLTFLVFVLSSMLLVVQLASAQLTPRIIAMAFADRVGKAMVSVLVFSNAFALGVLGRIEAVRVPQMSVLIALVSALIGIVLFLWFVQRLGSRLRPISVLRLVSEQGRSVIDSVYPLPFDVARSEHAAYLPEVLQKDARVIDHGRDSGVLLAFGESVLVRTAQAADCIIEMVAQVGDFVSRGDPLFRISPAARLVDDKALQDAVALGPERTLEQDPGFAFRIMVDIASRALSPAINDPTTAVLAIDQIHRLLRHVGSRQLDSGMICDSEGKLRLIVPAPRWEDFVCLAVSEIRLFGAKSLQVPRRLQAMLEHLIEVLPSPRAPALRQELALLHKAVDREYPEAEDRQRAETSDRQGLGGSSSQNV